MTRMLIEKSGTNALKALYEHAFEITSTNDVIGRIFEEDFGFHVVDCNKQKQLIELRQPNQV